MSCCNNCILSLFICSAIYADIPQECPYIFLLQIYVFLLTKPISHTPNVILTLLEHSLNSSLTPFNRCLITVHLLFIKCSRGIINTMTADHKHSQLSLLLCNRDFPTTNRIMPFDMKTTYTTFAAYQQKIQSI